MASLTEVDQTPEVETVASQKSSSEEQTEATQDKGIDEPSKEEGQDDQEGGPEKDDEVDAEPSPTAKAKLAELAAAASEFASSPDFRKWAAVGLSLLVVLVAIAVVLTRPSPKYADQSSADHAHSDANASETHAHEHADGCGCGHDHGHEHSHDHGDKKKMTEEDRRKAEEELMKMFGVNSREELEKMFKQPEPEEFEAAEGEDLSSVEFIAAEEYEGAKEGYYFRSDVQGIGYYKQKETSAEEPQESVEEVSAEEPQESVEEPQKETSAEGNELVMEGDLAKFRIKHLKRIIEKAGMDHSTLFEKPEYVKMAREARDNLAAAEA